jgi:hypothetical protein
LATKSSLRSVAGANGLARLLFVRMLLLDSSDA